MYHLFFMVTHKAWKKNLLIKYLCPRDFSRGEMEEMMKDLVDLLHDLEWWRSADSDEKRYRESVNKFKKKWFKQTKIDVQKQIESEFERTKNELLKEFEYLKDVE